MVSIPADYSFKQRGIMLRLSNHKNGRGYPPFVVILSNRTNGPCHPYARCLWLPIADLTPQQHGPVHPAQAAVERVKRPCSRPFRRSQDHQV